MRFTRPFLFISPNNNIASVEQEKEMQVPRLPQNGRLLLISYMFILCIKLVGVYLTDFAPPPQIELPRAASDITVGNWATQQYDTGTVAEHASRYYVQNVIL
jgi:hypothetical protein